MQMEALGPYKLEGYSLGKGNFARVVLATHKQLKIKVAIKIIDMAKTREDYVRKNLKRERTILDRLNHNNIVRLYETIKTNRCYCLVLEYVGGGDLSALLRRQRRGRLEEARARQLCSQISSALLYMHQRGIVHRDLKTENIMLNSAKDTVKIVDFGLSNRWSSLHPLATNCGSPEYAAPELFDRHRAYGPEIDVWSLGVVFFVMLTGRLPFVVTSSSRRQAPYECLAGTSARAYGDRTKQLVEQIRVGLQDEHEAMCRHLSADCWSLLSELLEPSIRHRISMRRVYQHSWFRNQENAPPRDVQAKSANPIFDEHIMAVKTTAAILNISRDEAMRSIRAHSYDHTAGIYNILMSKNDWLISRYKHFVESPKLSQLPPEVSSSQANTKSPVASQGAEGGRNADGRDEINRKQPKHVTISEKVRRNKSLETNRRNRDNNADHDSARIPTSNSSASLSHRKTSDFMDDQVKQTKHGQIKHSGDQIVVQKPPSVPSRTLQKRSGARNEDLFNPYEEATSNRRLKSNVGYSRTLGDQRNKTTKHCANTNQDEYLERPAGARKDMLEDEDKKPKTSKPPRCKSEHLDYAHGEKQKSGMSNKTNRCIDCSAPLGKDHQGRLEKSVQPSHRGYKCASQNVHAKEVACRIPVLSYTTSLTRPERTQSDSLCHQNAAQTKTVNSPKTKIGKLELRLKQRKNEMI